MVDSVILEKDLADLLNKIGFVQQVPSSIHVSGSTFDLENTARDSVLVASPVAPTLPLESHDVDDPLEHPQTCSPGVLCEVSQVCVDR